MSDIQEWAKDLKHNEKTANKYKGVKTVEDILRVAHSDGYTFTEKELLDFNLDLVAGGGGGGTGGVGLDINTTVDTGNKTDTKTTEQTQKEINTNLAQSANNQGSNNGFNFSGSNNNTQT